MWRGFWFLVDTAIGMAERFEKHSRTFSLLTLLSRLTGLARDATLSRVFGAAGVMDAFFFAFIIPNLFRRLFGEGALASAFIPTYAQLDKSDPVVAKRLACLVIACLVVVLGCLTLLGELGLYIVSLYSTDYTLALKLMMIMLPYMPLVCVVAIFGAMLQVHGKFGPSAAAPIVLNICLIAAAIVGIAATKDINAQTHVSFVAAAVVLAGVIQVLWMLLALRGRGWWTRDLRLARSELRKIMRLAGPMILGLGVLQLNTFFDALIASYPTTVGSTIFGYEYPLSQGAMAAVSFAQRLYQFPLGVFGIAIATAIYPALARLANDEDAFADTLRRGLRLVVFIGLPASAGLIIVAQPLSATILQGGDFSASDSDRVAFVLLGYATAVWAYSMTHVLTRAFYALGEVKTPVRIALSMVALNLVLNCTLIWTPLKESGLAWSTAICAVIQASLLLWRANSKIKNIVDKSVIISWTKTILATIVMFIIAWFVAAWLGAQTTWTGSLVTLLAVVFVGITTMFAVAGTLKMPELWWAIGKR